MIPVPGYKVTTRFGVRGRHWSCQRNAAGLGIHTGLDIAAPAGTPIVAPIAGQIRWRSYGRAFGRHQFAISPVPGQPFASGEVFFAHTRTRPKDGTRVTAGQRIAEVGAEGNVTGPHLHMEFMPRTKGRWACGLHADPQTVIDWQPQEDTMHWTDYSGKPSGTLTVSESDGYKRLDATHAGPPFTGLEHHLLYLNCELHFDAGKDRGVIRVKYVRDDGDDTGYRDFIVVKGDPFGEPDRFLLSHTHFEKGQKGLGGRWYIRVGGGLHHIVIGTRYAKIAAVS